MRRDLIQEISIVLTPEDDWTDPPDDTATASYFIEQFAQLGCYALTKLQFRVRFKSNDMIEEVEFTLVPDTERSMSFYSRFVSLTIGDSDAINFIHEFNRPDYFINIHTQFHRGGRGKFLRLILSGIRSLQKVTFKNVVLVQDLRNYIPGSKKFCQEDMCQAIGECLSEYDPAFVPLYAVSYTDISTAKIEGGGSRMFINGSWDEPDRFGEFTAAVDLIITRTDAEDLREDPDGAFGTFLEKWQKMEQGIEDSDNETNEDSDSD